MKKIIALTALTLLTLATAQAQPHRAGSASGGPHFGAALAKLFGDNQTFTTQLEFETADITGSAVPGQDMIVPGTMSFDNGKTCFQMNLSDIKGAKMPPQAAAQIKAMGMDSMTAISRPDKKVGYVIYTGMKSYLETPLTNPEDTATTNDYTIETTELGKETVDGHACVKSKVVVTDKDGNKHESTVWDATDLKKFPIKIVSTEQGHTTTMTFKNITFDKPDAANFDVPAGFSKYSSQQEMLQAVMMKQMGNSGMMGRPPGQ